MVKNLLPFLGIVSITNAAFTVFIGVMMKVPSEALIIALMLKTLFIFILLGTITRLFIAFTSEDPAAVFSFACLIMYVLMPLALTAIKPGQQTASEIFIELHTKKSLFLFICLPFILSCFTTIISFKKWYSNNT